MEFITDLISENNKLPAKTITNFKNLLSFQNVKKKHVLAKAGETPSEFYILKKGVVRSYFLDKKGREVIQSLTVGGASTGAFSSLILDKPSRIYYDCLTDCEFYVGDFKAFKKLTLKDINISLLYTKVLEDAFIKKEKRIYELSMLDATDRYLKIRKDLPNIEKQIPQYQIASFLNITPVQLSRIRKDLLMKRVRK
ncbi:MAG: Crp/Fnr family transcriptional regulator [Polaribacter sp.]|nr:Crp/Fnr family transcriptional regulator [Polaribacter sp.]